MRPLFRNGGKTIHSLKSAAMCACAPVCVCVCVFLCGLSTKNKLQYIKAFFRFFCDRMIRQPHVKRTNIVKSVTCLSFYRRFINVHCNVRDQKALNIYVVHFLQITNASIWTL